MLTINFKKWNIVLGWVAFFIAIVTYSITVEPTVSFWDAGEYISTSTKLQVGHPPGAPLYQMLGAFFSMFAMGNENIALMVNLVASLSSAFTILFMFWCATNILKKVVSSYTTIDNHTAIAILGSSLIGALAFTFSDTFWFSAVEAEVYATATMMIAMLLWMGLRWIDEMEQPRADKWLVLIALVLGLSFGVHFMALLTIPSIGYLYYFRKYPKVTVTNFILANILIVSILLFVFLFLMPYTMAFFGKSEIFFVNTFGLPFNAGTIIAFLAITAFFIFSLRYTQKKKHVRANTLILSLLFVFIGFSTWLMLPIRSNTQIPINENKPSDAAELLAYYNREQYGTRSLFYDTYYTLKYRRELDENKPYVDAKPNYERDEASGKYVITNKYENAETNYSSKLKGFLPRMYSTDGSHPINYMRYTQPLDFKLKPEKAGDPDAMEMERQIRAALNSGQISLEEFEKYYLPNPEFEEIFEVQNPTFGQNMQFMFDYQFGYMYWRYLMWNFSGRQNDVQGTNDRLNGNWVTGITFLDEIRLGSQKNLPSDVLNNKGRNHYYMIPFLLGLIGFIFHFRRDPKSFYVLLALFLFTSFALKIFLNERPFEPRERDYAVVASFMVFAIWLGFGVFAVYEEAKKVIQPKIALPAILALGLLGAPVVMAKENWNDHDRSDRYTALATAKAYLDSLEPNAIIFTIGDNDTFPLWYLQEVEEYRTDVRVVCTALLQAEWYIDQMKVKAYESEPLKIRFDHKQYAGSNMYAALIMPTVEDRVDINSILDYIGSGDPRTKLEREYGADLIRIPTNKLRLQVDKENVLKNNIVSQKHADKIVPHIDIDIKSSELYRMRIIMLDIIANNNWERPIYFTGGSLSDEDFLWMKDYLQLSGYAYQLVPIKAPKPETSHPLYIGSIDTERMYNTVMKWNWGNYGNPNIYHDPETRKNALFFRVYMTRLAEQLAQEGQHKKAKDIVDTAMKNFPIDYYDSYSSVEPFAELYYYLGEKQKAKQIVDALGKKYEEKLIFFQSMKSAEQNDFFYEIIENLQGLERLIEVAQKDDPMTAQKHKAKLEQYRKQFIRFIRAAGLEEIPEIEELPNRQEMDSANFQDGLNFDTMPLMN